MFELLVMLMMIQFIYIIHQNNIAFGFLGIV